MFDWSHCGVTGSRYDAKKFLHVQSTHLRMVPDAELANKPCRSWPHAA